MTDWKLPLADLRILVEIMMRTGLFNTPSQRENFFAFSGYTDAFPHLQAAIPLTDGTDEFCRTLVRRLMGEGLLPDGSHHAIYLLLRYLLASISGHTTEKLFVEKIIEESEGWVHQHRVPAAQPLPLINLNKIYEEAVTHFFEEQWEEVLHLVATLEAGQYDDSRRMTKLADMKREASAEQDIANRRRDYDADYQQVVRLTRDPKRLSLAKQAWATFQQKHHIDFSPAHDPENLSGFFEQQRLLDVMYDLNLPPSIRAKAGRDLAEIGDPRPEVMDVDSMHFCWIPEGRFWMGSASKEEDPLSYDWERPAGWCDIPYGYWIARFPVTNAHYRQFVIDTESKNASHDYGEPYHLPNHPIVGVSWQKALAFTQWLTARWQKTSYLPQGWSVTLPNEPEWEKAARGGEIISLISFAAPTQLGTHPRIVARSNPLPRRRYPYGNDPDSNHSNYDQSQITSTNAVGCFRGGISPYGCEEISGGVWEWCRSHWDEKYPFTNDRDDMTLHNRNRVLRGGAFDLNERFVRCAYRIKNRDPFGRDRNFGFRVAVVAVSLS